MPRTSRAKRPAVITIAELRALAGIALERALVDSAEPAQEQTLVWARELAAEIDLLDVLGAPVSWGDLVNALARVHAAAPGQATATKTAPGAKQRMRRAR